MCSVHQKWSVPRRFDKPRAVDVLGKVPTVRHRHHAIAFSMQHQRRRMDEGQGGAHVDVHV